MSSLTLLYFFSFVLRGINVPLWRLTELFSLRIGATRWVGSRSGSTKNLTDTEYYVIHTTVRKIPLNDAGIKTANLWFPPIQV